MKRKYLLFFSLSLFFICNGILIVNLLSIYGLAGDSLGDETTKLAADASLDRAQLVNYFAYVGLFISVALFVWWVALTVLKSKKDNGRSTN